MPPKFIDKRKRENWDHEADRELKRRDKTIEKVTARETKWRERAEASKWKREIWKEQVRREKVAAKETKRREHAEFLKWNREIEKKRNVVKIYVGRGRKNLQKFVLNY